MIKNRKTTVSRRNQILNQLSDVGEVLVSDLSKEFGVSEVTIRNDLGQLEKKRLLVRARGGAMKYEGGVGVDYGLNEKDKINLKEKIQISQEATKYINDGDIIILDSGTTTAELAKNLGHFKDLTVITNAINIAIILAQSPNINVIMTGGHLRQNSQSLIGPLAQKSLSRMHVDKLFLGVDGIDLSSGLYTPNIEEAFLNEHMINISNQLIVLADSSKFNKQSFAHICGLEKIDYIITDDKIVSEHKHALEEKGIEIVVA